MGQNLGGQVGAIIHAGIPLQQRGTCRNKGNSCKRRKITGIRAWAHLAKPKLRQLSMWPCLYQDGLTTPLLHSFPRFLCCNLNLMLVLWKDYLGITGHFYLPFSTLNKSPFLLLINTCLFNAYWGWVAEPNLLGLLGPRLLCPLKKLHYNS